jgi:membrane protease YdiL (CAAX protease family)
LVTKFVTKLPCDVTSHLNFRIFDHNFPSSILSLQQTMLLRYRQESINVLLLAATALWSSSSSYNAALAFSVTARPSQHAFDRLGIHPRYNKKACYSSNDIIHSRRKSLALASSSDDNSENTGSATSFKQVIYNVVTLIGAQALLVPIAVFIAQLINLPNIGLGSQFHLGSGATIDGLRWTLPLFGVAGLLRLVEPYSDALQNVTKATQRSVFSVLGSTRRPFFALLVSCILGAVAGIGEEWLFRGVFQEVLTQKFGSSISLAVSGVVFGLLHAVTPVYALLAGAASVFFGYLYIVSHNLAVPMITHAVYDVFALMWAHWTVTALGQEEIDEILNYSGAPVLSANTFKEGHLDVSNEEDGEDDSPKVYNS